LGSIGQGLIESAHEEQIGHFGEVLGVFWDGRGGAGSGEGRFFESTKDSGPITGGG
jgi:hypothetical protein